MGSKSDRGGVEINVSKSVLDFIMCVLCSCVSRVKGRFREVPAPIFKRGELKGEKRLANAN